MINDTSSNIQALWRPVALPAEGTISAFTRLINDVKNTNTELRKWNRPVDGIILRSLTGFFPANLYEVQISCGEDSSEISGTKTLNQNRKDSYDFLSGLCQLRLRDEFQDKLSPKFLLEMSGVLCPKIPERIEDILIWQIITTAAQANNRRGPLRKIMEKHSVYDVSAEYSPLLHMFVIKMKCSQPKELWRVFEETVDEWVLHRADVDGAKERMKLRLKNSSAFTRVAMLLPYKSLDFNVGENKLMKCLEQISVELVNNQLREAYRTELS